MFIFGEKIKRKWCYQMLASKETEKKSFVLYDDYKEHVEMLSNTEAGILFKAIFEYRATNIAPNNLEGEVKMAFSFIRAGLARDTKKWEKIRTARIEAGKKGGLASGEARKKENQAN